MHIILIVVYSVIAILLWQARTLNSKVSKELLIQKDINETVRLGLKKQANDVIKRIEQNEKLVAEAKKKIAAQTGAIELGPDGRVPFDQDAPLMASVLTALVVKYGDMALSLDDMRRVTQNDYISVYVDTGTQELILSNDHDMVGADDLPDLFNIHGGDDETFH
jgi:ribosomal protein RSM22 (predicted rRNA methylase)